MPFDALYCRSKEWRKRRLEALEAGGYICARCEDTDNLQVHHLNYDRLGAELPEDLEVLCIDCHREAHGNSIGGRIGPQPDEPEDTLAPLRLAELQRQLDRLTSGA